MHAGGQARCHDRRSRRRAREVLARRGARSNFLGYHGFPAVACISPNEVIVHGIPDDRVIDEGDIVSVDCGAIVEGWHADAAITIPVGTIDDESQRLLDATRAVARGRDRPGRRPGTGSATSAPPSRASPRPPGSPSCGSTWATASAPRCTKTRRCPTTERPAGGCGCDRAWCWRSSRCLNAGKRTDPPARRRLDRRDRRRLPIRPLRAHRRHHRQRPRGPDPPVMRRDRMSHRPALAGGNWGFSVFF